MSTRTTNLALLLLTLAGCGAPTSRGPAAPADESAQARADQLIAFYTPIFVALYREANAAAWTASTDVTDEHTGARMGADAVMSAFAGNAMVIRETRELLDRRAELADLTVRQLRAMLQAASYAPQTNPELARRRVELEARQSARLDGYAFCVEREGAACRREVTANDIDGVLFESRDLAERLRYWEASKEIGVGLRPGLLELRDVRNGVAREMGFPDFFTMMVDDYGMTTPEMMELLDRLAAETRPLFVELHCWAKHELARRYGVAEVPAEMPAHWLPNRWAQSWPGLVASVDMDGLVEGRTKEWLVEQAERFYVSLGFRELPRGFWERSDLYPVPDGASRRKNSHASAWHIDLEEDVRSLMSVEPTWEWFQTTHHELGHIYYDLSYARPEVPPLLREGANRSYHEGVGDLIALASSQAPYLREIGLLDAGTAVDETRWLLDSALTGAIVFLPFAAGTMSHFEQALYGENLSEAELNTKWWELVRRYQGVVPPGTRPSEACDACSKTHINDDPGGYYDYALANVLVHQLHDHICRNLLAQDPHACNYYGRPEVGEFLRSILSLGRLRDWREVLREATGSELTALPMLDYYRPLLDHLRRENRGRACELAAPGAADPAG